MPEIHSGWVEFAQFILNLLILGAVGIWRFSQVEKAISDKCSADIESYRREIDLKMTTLREKQSEIELWVLEQFVRREDLRSAIDQINVTLAGIRQSFDVRMDRIETKLDNLNKH